MAYTLKELLADAEKLGLEVVAIGVVSDARENVTKPQRRVYKVQAGDTLSEIAERLKTTVADLAEQNDIDNPNLIYVGEELYY